MKEAWMLLYVVLGSATPVLCGAVRNRKNGNGNRNIRVLRE